MRIKRILVLITFVAVIFMAFGFQNSSEHKVLFEKAKFTMETKGDLKGAIELFEQIIKKYPDEREYAAKSQYYIGICYEKLGLKQAQDAFQKVVDNYPEQSEVVKMANEKLSILLRAQKVIEKGAKEFTIRQVWAGPDVDFLGAPSPDSRYLSFVDWNTGDIALRDLDTGKNRRLSNKGSWFQSSDFALFSIWSPDGKNVAYNWLSDKDGIFDLRICGLEDSTHRILYNKSEYTHPLDWSSDGKYILTYFTEDNKTVHLGLLSVQDGSMHALKPLGRFYPSNASLSPDGRHFVYDLPLEKDSFHRDIFMLSTDGKHEIDLVVHPADDALLGWTPDGKSILFVSDRTGTLDVWSIQVSRGKPQGKPELIRKDIGQIEPIGFTQNGSLYYGLETGMQDAYIATLDIEKGKLLSPPKKASQRFIGSNISPDWSPDGKYLAYVSKRLKGPERPGSRVLCIKNLESGEEKEFIPELRNFGRFLYWAPDGLSIIVTGVDMKYRQGLYKIDAQTGNSNLLFQNKKKTAIINPVLSHDGKEIFYRRRDDKRNVSFISQYNLFTEQEKELYNAPIIINLILSPDGKFLAFGEVDNKIRATILKIISVRGGEPHELTRVEQPESITYQSCTWTPDGRYILFGTGGSTMQHPAVELWRISMDGGEPQKLGLSMDWMRHVRVHPDGKRITFFAGKSNAEIWVMENYLQKEEAQKKSK